MSNDISLLPEELRQREEGFRSSREVPEDPAHSSKEIKFSVPAEDQDDMEVIEIDEGEVDQVLAGEPWPSKIFYRLTSWVADAKHALLEPHAFVPPPKSPPQFFTPPVPKTSARPPASSVASVNGSVPSTTSSAKTKATITPFASAPKRIRVVKRIRKPVHVSFISEAEMQLSRVDVGKRRFTLVFFMIFFVCALGVSAYALNIQRVAAHEALVKADAQFADVTGQIQAKQSRWSAFQDLEPRLKALNGLLNAHVSPNRLFQEIETHTLPTVFYGSLSLTPDKRVTLVTSADSLSSAAAQIAAFEAASFVKKVEVSGYSLKYDPPDAPVPARVDFQIILTLADEALRRLNEAP